MNLYSVNPLSDQRWDDLVARHPHASAFHQRGWLEALRRTYGYKPVVLTTTPPGEKLSNGIVFCVVDSWLTGRRLVSLPFADHCEPLLGESGSFLEFVDGLRAEFDRQACKYLEIRPRSEFHGLGMPLQPSRSFCFHALDLRPGREQIFRALHKDSIQRKIRRAEKERLSYQAGRSDQLLEEFYRLLLITRRRHQLPPQPRIWFRNLTETMGEGVQIHVARKNGDPIAAMLTLRHRSSTVYKYGCSNQAFHQLGGMPFLFWRLIEQSIAEGAEEIDFGRSDLDNEGLLAFKDKFGTTRTSLTYYRYPGTQKPETAAHWGSRPLRQIFSVLPDAVLSTAGRILYRHIG